MPLTPLLEGDPRSAGPYALRARLGSGGMGQVFLADGPRGDRVAVKLLHPYVAGHPDARARLARELRTLSRVRGPHLAEVVDADVDAPRPFIVTRYVPGPTLEERVAREGPLDVHGLLGVARGLATALAAVHAAGVVHRDLKPGNVICGPEGPTLLDFGIASAVDEAVLTRSGEVWGTPAYLAPEQVVSGRAEPASDIHALGSTLVYAATGRPLFGTGRADVVLYRVVHDRPALPELPAPLARLAAVMVDPDPARRPSAAALLGALAPASQPPARTLHTSTATAGGTSLLTTAVPTRTATMAVPAELSPWQVRPAPPARMHAPTPSAVPTADPVQRPGPPGTPRQVAPDTGYGDALGPEDADQRLPGPTAGPWAGRLVGVTVVAALAAGALVAPLAVPLLAWFVLLPVHDALGRTHAAAIERRSRRGPRATDGFRSGAGFVGQLLGAVLGSVLRLPLLLPKAIGAASAGFLLALFVGADSTTALEWSSGALTAGLGVRLLSARRHRHAAAARAELRRRAGLAGVLAAGSAFVLLALILVSAAAGEPSWFPLAARPELPYWATGLWPF